MMCYTSGVEPSKVIDLVFVLIAVPLVIWSFVDLRRRRRRDRDVKRLFERVDAEGWTDESRKELARLYPLRCR